VSEAERLIELAQAAARRERAPAHLAARVLEDVAYRIRLEAPFAAQRRVRRVRLIAGACALVAAAAVIAMFNPARPPTPRIAAEPEPAIERPTSIVPSRPVSPPPSVSLQTPCRERVTASGQSPLVDDFEDGDDALAPLEKRAGFWRWARESDAPGTAPALLPVPRIDGTPRNKLALHVKGGRLYDWGATVEVNFRPACYDATAYAGIKLQARGPGRVFVAVREMSVIPSVEGGSCERDCYNAHAAKIELTSEWRSYELRWSELIQRGINRPALDASRLHSIAFLIHSEDTPYDLWLDDVRFLVQGS
jgi:hypothetical protein